MIKLDSKICILGGGWSNEREISLKSSNDVFQSLKNKNHNVIFYDMVNDSFDDLKMFLKNQSIDIVFNLMHGEGGEDGKVQSYLDKLNIKYCGSDSKSSSLSFNKYLTKSIWIDNNLLTPDFLIYDKQSYEYLTKKFSPSFFIKDTCSGSSNNIFLIQNIEDFNKFLSNSSNRQFMIEKKIYAQEYTAAIINNKVLPIIKIEPSNNFYDFDAKYKSDKTRFSFPDLNKNVIRDIHDSVLKAFHCLGCHTWARVDFFIDNNKIVLLEINTIPGMTDHSLVPKAAKESGLSYYELIIEILGINA